MDALTEDELAAAVIYGFCEFCGGPRDVETTRTFNADTGVLEHRMAAVCLRCGREAI